MKQLFPDKKIWISDAYSFLVNFWVIVQKNIDLLIKKVYEWKKIYLVGKELYQFLNENIENFDDLERAAAFFIYNRITFSGTTMSGGYSEKAFTGRFTESNIQRLHDLRKVMDGVIVTQTDYEEVVNKEDENVFIFLDPPYVLATKSALYGKNGHLHKNFDHQRFAETVKRCPHKWLITYDDCETVRDLFSFACIIPWNLTYGMRNVSENSNQMGKELFISNYPHP